MASKSRVLITSPGRVLELQKQKLLQLIQSFGELASFHDLANKNNYYGLQGFVCDYFDTRVASNAISNLNGSMFEVSFFYLILLESR